MMLPKVMSWIVKWALRQDHLADAPKSENCIVPGCDEPAVESWFPSVCALRESGIKIEWVGVCAEHDCQMNETHVRQLFGDKYDEHLLAYRMRRAPETV